MCGILALEKGFFVEDSRRSSVRLHPRPSSVLAHGCVARLQTWTRREGNIRLSMDDGPPAREFLDEDYDDDNEAIADDEPLALRAQQLRAKNAPAPTPSRPTAPQSPSPNLPLPLEIV